MKIHLIWAAVAAFALTGCGKGDAPAEPVAGEGAMAAAIGGDAPAMQATSSIAANLAASPIHRSLAAALAQAGLAAKLSGAGPFTVFAPTDAGFTQVPPVTRDGWMRPAQQAVLASVLDHHIVPGRLTAADLAAKIAKGGGRAVLRTAGGQDLIATKSGNRILLTSGSGNKAAVTGADLAQSNGVVHVIDAVLVPAM
ncbi:Beta-Ig-H3/fasciclin [uncultured Sphingopyxis sp.]|uniref:Beta-Ig-H3/fasciclin n=1 Tax=uncultured Sphingopyxis sp. TaxID=310581 RepID=A0A1Y5PTA2_9SPHN|nr:fasciclin domain-containing protein [uncultured Sphingopyxis sp.]SBV33253.1 Beta-Ig-H3/fasciclin [uncultured Sphingopyxis sp.]